MSVIETDEIVSNTRFDVSMNPYNVYIIKFLIFLVQMKCKMSMI